MILLIPVMQPAAKRSRTELAQGCLFKRSPLYMYKYHEK